MEAAVAKEEGEGAVEAAVAKEEGALAAVAKEVAAMAEKLATAEQEAQVRLAGQPRRAVGLVGTPPLLQDRADGALLWRSDSSSPLP